MNVVACTFSGEVEQWQLNQLAGFDGPGTRFVLIHSDRFAPLFKWSQGRRVTIETRPEGTLADLVNAALGSIGPDDDEFLWFDSRCRYNPADFATLEHDYRTVLCPEVVGKNGQVSYDIHAFSARASIANQGRVHATLHDYRDTLLGKGMDWQIALDRQVAVL